MKRNILVMLIAAVTLMMTACGNKTEEASKQETTPVETQTQAVESAETQTLQETSQEADGEIAETEGMVIAAAMNSLTIQTTEGAFELFAYPDEGVEAAKEGGILLGEVVKVSYTGNVENGDAKAVKIEAGTTQTALPREAYEFALTAINCAKFNDLDGLANLVTYPVYVGIGEEGLTPKDEAEFLEIDRDSLLSLGVLADFNMFNMSESKAGIVIGDAKPNIIFKHTDTGYGIVGINIE